MKNEYYNKVTALSKKELDSLTSFVEKHKRCPRRGAISREVGIFFHINSVGDWVEVVCPSCCEHKDISDEKRSNW